MRFTTTILSLSLIFGAAMASPIAAPQTGTPTVDGSACTCGQAPNIVYSECLLATDGTRHVFNCMPGSGGCSWDDLGAHC